MQILSRLIGVVNSGLAEISSWAAFALTIIVTVDVVLRYIFRESIPAGEELTRLLMVILVFFAFGKAQEKKVHIRVDFFIEKMPPKMRRYWEVIVHLFALIFIWLLFWEAIEALRVSLATKEFYPGVIRVPLYPGRGAIGVGCGLIMIALIREIAYALMQKVPSVPAAAMDVSSPDDLGEKFDK